MIVLLLDIYSGLVLSLGLLEGLSFELLRCFLLELVFSSVGMYVRANDDMVERAYVDIFCFSWCSKS
jgi:hypothetical protein